MNYKIFASSEMVLEQRRKDIEMNKFLKALTGTAAAAAMAVSATPAVAKDGHDKGIGAGEVIAGALVIGGIAALAGAFDGDKKRYRGDYRYDRAGYRGDYRNGYRNRSRNNFRSGLHPRKAVNRCIRVAERRAGRAFGAADVTQIRDVDRTRYGYRVKGRIVVQNGYRGRGYRNSFDRGRFTCFVGGGRGADVTFRGLGNGR